MDELTRDWPFVAVWVFFFAGALTRGTAFYWLGRGARSAGNRARRWTDNPNVARAERVVARYGAPVVTLCFLTVGVQSAVLTAAGVLRMPGRQFAPAVVVGAAI